MCDVSELGRQAAIWSDDNLVSKRILPGAHLRCASKQWASRTKITDQSFVSFVKFRTCQHKMTVLPCRKKMARADAEEIATQAAVAHHLAAEVQECQPFLDDHIFRAFIQTWEGFQLDAGICHSCARAFRQISVDGYHRVGGAY